MNSDEPKRAPARPKAGGAGRRRAPLPTLFDDEEGSLHQEGLEPFPSTLKSPSDNATDVAERTLRRQDGELREVRHPIEIAALEPKTRRLTALSRRVWTFLVSYSLEAPGAMTPHGVIWRVALSTLMKDIQYGSNDTAHLKDALRQSQRTLVEWASSARDSTTNEVRPWSSTQLLGSVEYVVDATGLVYIEWTFPPVLLRQLQDHKHYFVSPLAITNLLTRHSSLALLPLASRYKTSPGGLTPKRPWREWIPILTGESEESAQQAAKLRAAKSGGVNTGGKYKEWRYFNRDVVSPAVEELNSVVTDFWVQAVPIKEGRETAYLQFKITPRSGFSNRRAVNADVPDGYRSAVEAMTALGIKTSLAVQLCHEHTPELMLKVAEKTSARVNNRQLPPIENVPGLLIKVKDEIVGARRHEEPVAVPNPTANAKPPDLAATESLEDYRADLASRERTEWDRHPREVQDDYIDQFRERELPNATGVIRSSFAKSGIKEPMVRAKFFRWLAEERAGERWTLSDRELVAYERSRRATNLKG